MHFVKCSDIVKMSIDEFTPTISDDYFVNREYYSVLMEYCDEFDKLGEEFCVQSITSSVDENMIIHIVFEFEDITVQDRETYSFYDLIDRSVGVSFSYQSEDVIRTEFMFPSIWEKRKIGVD